MRQIDSSLGKYRAQMPTKLFIVQTLITLYHKFMQLLPACHLLQGPRKELTKKVKDNQKNLKSQTLNNDKIANNRKGNQTVIQLHI